MNYPNANYPNANYPDINAQVVTVSTGIIVLLVFAVMIILAARIIFAYFTAKIACNKHMSFWGWFLLTFFFLGIIGLILVCLLPNGDLSVSIALNEREAKEKKTNFSTHSVTNTWRCEQCGKTNPFANNFCSDCGHVKPTANQTPKINSTYNPTEKIAERETENAWVCPKCGHTNKAASTVCKKCWADRP